MNINANYTRKFGIQDKVGYAFGDFANCLTFTLCSLFFLKFYEEVVGIPPVIIGAFMMACKFFDAFTDVIMGQICDKSKPTKKGRFAPWMMRFAGPVCVAAFLMFAPWVKNMAMPAKIFWMVFTYILYGSICYTGVNIPYGSMASAISASPKDRTELSNFRAIGGQIGGTVIGVVLPILAYQKVGDKQILLGDRVMWITIILGCLAFALYLLCYFMTTERVKVKNKVEKFSIIKVFKTWFTSKSVLIVIIATIICITGTTYFDSMKSYVFVNIYGSPAALSASTFTNFGIVLLLSFIMLPLTNLLGRKSLMVIGMLFMSGMFLLLGMLQLQNVNVWLFFSLYSVAFIGNAIFNLICWAMVGDVIDESEIKFKKREDGSIYGAYSFSRKMGQALASGISGALLTFVGVGKAGTETIYTPELKARIFNISTFVPAILFALTGLLFLFLYPLNKRVVNENATYLKINKAIDKVEIRTKGKELVYENYTIVLNKTLEEYNIDYSNTGYDLIKLTKQEVEDFDKKNHTKQKNYLLKDHTWWLIDGVYYEIPK